MVSKDVPADSVVCRPCRQNVTRVIADAEYMPRWGKESVESSCCVQNCSEFSIAHASMCSSDEFMQIQGIDFQNEPIPVPTPLCKSYYHAVYDALQTRHKNCRTCGRRLRMGMDRPCPQPKYLYEHTDFTGNIVPSDRVCLTCYKSHLVLLKENKPVSRDSDLQSLVDCIIRAATDHMLALEETVHNGMDLEEEEEEEFADFVFDAATDVNTELNSVHFKKNIHTHKHIPPNISATDIYHFWQ